MIGKCKLCFKDDVNLVSKSHIISDFMYQELFDDKHRLINVHNTKLNQTSTVQTGVYDRYILCENCENSLLGSYETYASKILYGGKVNVKVQNFIKPDGLEYSLIENIDYKKFKIFLLSILWRSSVSTHAFFKNVDLGLYEERIRLMILNGDSGEERQYPCVISSCRKQSLSKGIIVKPTKVKWGHSTAYSYLISGVLYFFIVNENEKTPWILQAAINKKNQFHYLHANKRMANEYLNNCFQAELF